MTPSIKPRASDPRRVLITGASSGVGEATARLFAAEGAHVALLARRRDELRRVADELGGNAHPIEVDVADACSASRAVRDAIAVLGGVDIAVNAAGVAGAASLDEVDDELWRTVLDTNLSGTFTVSREVGLHMRANGGGSIVNVASDLAHMGARGLVHYCAAKAGVVGLTRGLAVELAPAVRVNVICPGPIDTPMLQAQFDGRPDAEAVLAEQRGSVPLLRLADPEEVATAIRFLAVEATFATGSNLALDGGTSAA